MVIGPQADELERQAAQELCRYLNKLFGVKAQPTTKLPQSAETILLIGSKKTNPAVTAAMGDDYIDCFVGRRRFAIHYLDAADAFGATASAEKASNLEEARRQANITVESIRAALEAYAEIVRDHGDLGALALMNKYCYRPIRDKRNELRGMNEGTESR